MNNNNDIRVSIAILSWNNCDETLGALKSLEKLSYRRFDVLVIDNGSEDNSVKILRDYQKTTNLKLVLIENSSNKGFSGGCSDAFIWAQKKGVEYVLLLNNDTEVDTLFLDSLVQEADKRPEGAFFSPSIYFYSDPSKLWFGGSAKMSWTKMNRSASVGLLNKEKPPEALAPLEIDFASGCCMLCRMDAIKDIGTFDDRFFLYFEDVDLSLRARSAGWKIFWVPNSSILHKVSATTMKELGAPALLYYDVRNSLLTSKKSAPFWMNVYRPLWSVYMSLKQLAKIFLFRKDVARSRAVLQGIKDYYLGNFGKYKSGYD